MPSVVPMLIPGERGISARLLKGHSYSAVYSKSTRNISPRHGLEFPSS